MFASELVTKLRVVGLFQTQAFLYSLIIDRGILPHSARKNIVAEVDFTNSEKQKAQR
jgi:hypothetical protein